jgi:hypothetical protein
MKGIVFLAIAGLVVVVAIVRMSRRTRGRRAGGVGSAAVGAVYDLLNEDKRRAVEIIVEQKAAAVDPERARDKNPKDEPEGPTNEDVPSAGSSVQ